MAEPLATRADIARLFGRAAFGATNADLDFWTGKPYVDAVDHLLTGPDAPEMEDAVTELYRQTLQLSGNLEAHQHWWLEQMRTTSWPIRERMTLFWHNHFATAVNLERPDAFMLMQQTNTLRLKALGNFRDLVAAMNVDEAMLYWLNGAQSSPPKPNENYAREFFELFTLGKSPQVYSETDIREAARAFTGWNPNGTNGSFDANRHDHGAKHVLGVTVPDLGAAEHLEMVAIALRQPVSYRFIAWKLVLGFAYVPPVADLMTHPDPLVAKVAHALEASDWSIREGLRALLLADEFRRGEPHLYRHHVRQPVQQVVHACRAFGVGADNDAIRLLCQRMAQELFKPPNVGGWPVGTSWLSPATMTAYYDMAFHILNAWNAAGPTDRAVIPEDPFDYDGWARQLGLADIHPHTRGVIDSYRRSAHPHSTVEELRQGVVALLFSAPDWMVI